LIQMSFMGTVGSVAQAGQVAASAPTGVSIATGSSGNYDNAMITGDSVYDSEGGTSPDVHIFNPTSSFSYNSTDNVYLVTKTVDVADFSGFTGVSSNSDIVLKAYCRATNATSFQWTMVLGVESSLTNVSLSVQNSGGTSQDSTGSSGAAIMRMTWGGNKSGFLFPEDGDELVLKLQCTATNSGGSTAAIPVQIKFKYVS
jgi:hypothetical protein